MYEGSMKINGASTEQKNVQQPTTTNNQQFQQFTELRSYVGLSSWIWKEIRLFNSSSSIKRGIFSFKCFFHKLLFYLT